MCLLFEYDQLGVSNVFMAVFSDEHERLRPMSPSLSMGDCVPRVSIARGSRECYTMGSSTSDTTGMFQSTVLTCPWLISWSSVRSA
jgi:hypothetical protein